MTEPKQMVQRPVALGGKNNNSVTLDAHELGGELVRAIRELQQLQEDYGHLGTLSLRLEYVPYGDGAVQYELYVRREETDEEVTARMTQKKRAQEYRTTAEKRRLVELLEKYGDPTK